MISKEEYKKTLVRMWDSVREEYKGASGCDGVICNVCPATSMCGDYMENVNNAYDLIELVEKWAKEHPIVTNGDKFKELFGKEILMSPHGCVGLLCQSPCDTCPNNGFWNKEYNGEE